LPLNLGRMSFFKKSFNLSFNPQDKGSSNTSFFSFMGQNWSLYEKYFDNNDDIVKRIIEGIKGMMFFSNPHSLILNEVLAEAISRQGRSLGSTALIKAGILAEQKYLNSISHSYYKGAYKAAYYIQSAGGNPKLLHKLLNKYYANIVYDLKKAKMLKLYVAEMETKWILQGKNPEKEFINKEKYQLTLQLEDDNEIFQDVIPLEKNLKQKSTNIPFFITKKKRISPDIKKVINKKFKSSTWDIVFSFLKNLKFYLYN